MDINLAIVAINIFVLIILLVSFFKSKEKSLQGVRIAVISFVEMMPFILVIILFIGIMQGFLSSETITQYLGESSGFKGIIFAGIIGTILHLPALISFPLVASLIENGAGIMVAAVFITTSTMVSWVTLPFEIKELGGKMAILRNFFSLIIALIIAVIMGVLLT
ncbi:MAG: permease [Candidatus Aenigmarchaeota archaeon]|nr:permease [Candidatus Aenigmarchaeota archaeon]